MINVTTVSPDGEWLLILTFSNGERRRIDLQPYLHLPVYRRLENPGFFALARVDYGTLVWPGEIDIARETLYDLSLPLATVAA